MNYIVVYNPCAANGKSIDVVRELMKKKVYKNARLVDITEIESYEKFFEEISANDIIILAGGDGTLNRFVNDIDGLDVENDIYYCAAGSGNDFARDIAKKDGEVPCINEYIKDLPEICVNGKKSKFINGIGYGIDGYCCEVADLMREKGISDINYASIAIKGLFGKYSPTNATVTVDGVKHTYKKVWLAPTMNGRYYGGGIMPTPDRDRLNDKDTLSVMIVHDIGRLHTLMIFPSLFKGEHIKHKKTIEILSGKEITVEFDRKTALQIDGETVKDVCEYTAFAHSNVPAQIK